MKKKFLKHLSLLLTVMFLVSLLVGCAPQEVPPASSSEDSSGTASVGSNEVSNLDAQSPIDKTEDAIEYVLSEEDQDNFSDRKYAADVVYFYPKSGNKNLRDYTIDRFPEIALQNINYDDGFLILHLKYPGKDNAVAAVELLNKRDDVDVATVEEDYEPYYYEITEESVFLEDRIIASVQPSARMHTYTVEDFPELDCVEVTEHGASGMKYLRIYLKNPSRENVLEAVEALKGREDFFSVEPNVLVPVDGMIDGVLDVGDTAELYQQYDVWGMDAIWAYSAWSMGTGSSSVLVGVIDTGINGSHPALADAVNETLSESFVGAAYDPLVDPNGHGTHVAGIIAANEDEGYGFLGVSWGVQLVSLRASTTTTTGSAGMDPYAVVDAILYADEIGIDVINLSSSGYSYNSNMRNAIRNFDGVFVCSAGNNNMNLDENTRYPGAYMLSNMLVVGAAAPKNAEGAYQKWSGSNYGPVAVSLFAPGEHIYSCFQNGYAYMSGTSMAAPFVAGVAALVCSVAPNMSPALICLEIENNVEIHSSLSSCCRRGGFLDAYETLYDTHTCSYTEDDPMMHMVFCACGRYLTYHSYDEYYEYCDDLTHYAYCSCGDYIIENHSFSLDDGGMTQRCSDCAFAFPIARVSPEYESQ